MQPQMGDYFASRENLAASHLPPQVPHKLADLAGPGVSNVILRDFLLQGGHPGNSSAEIVGNLKPLLSAGVTTFVCLQAELPSAATHAVAQSRSAVFGANSMQAAKPYMSGAVAMVEAGGYPTSSAPERLSFVHYPLPAGGAAPDLKVLREIVRVPPRQRVPLPHLVFA
jgi:hypothetical protein